MSKKLTKEEFIKRAKEVHGDKYDYSKVEYINYNTPVCIICPKHGEFWQQPQAHISGKCSCPKCVHRGYSYTTQEFIIKAKERYSDKFTYEKTVYKNKKTKVCVTCRKHGDIWVWPSRFLTTEFGCKKCAREYISKIQTKTKKEFVRQANKIHNNKYDYSKFEYKTKNKKSCIICPIHGEFWQSSDSHLQGHGCPKCHSSKLERTIEHYLVSNNIKFESQKTFKWLKNDGNLYLDFYLPKYNLAIECQGEQHYKPIKHFGGEPEFNITQIRDKKKKELCDKHNIKILYYAKPEFPCTFSNIEDLSKYLSSLKNAN